MMRSQDMVRKGAKIAVGHGSCEQCQSTLLSIEMNTDQMTASVGVLTDLQRDEVERFLDGERITADDVIDVHAALRNTATLKKRLSKQER